MVDNKIIVNIIGAECSYKSFGFKIFGYFGGFDEGNWGDGRGGGEGGMGWDARWRTGKTMIIVFILE